MRSGTNQDRGHSLTIASGHYSPLSWNTSIPAQYSVPSTKSNSRRYWLLSLQRNWWNTLKPFHGECEDRIRSNTLEGRALAAQRDALLPKLVTGKEQVKG